jgi:Tol biopolymer transport system component
MRISANGGTPGALIKSKSVGSAFPQILPGGKSVLYTTFTQSEPTIMVGSLESGETKAISAGVGARYLPTGHIVYAVGNNLLAVPFDPDRLEMKGGPVPIVEGVFRINGPQYDLSDSGTLAYIPGTAGAAAAGRTLVWVDRQGKEEPITAPPNMYMFPKISPDGTRVALTIGSGNLDIWIWDLIRKTLTRLTFDDTSESAPIWTPDGKRILFVSNRDGANGIYWKPADGTGVVEKFATAPDRTLLPYSFSSDGKVLITGELGASSTKADIGMLSMEGNHARKALLQEKFDEVQPKISPDGQWMAYSSTESGQNEVYVRPFPDIDKGKWQASTSGGSSPLWAPNGRELFYLSNDNSVMAVPVDFKPALNLGTPKILFRSTYIAAGPTSGTPWDINSDGKRFLMMKGPESSVSTGGGPRKINIVLNWLEELKQRVPVHVQ